MHYERILLFNAFVPHTGQADSRNGMILKDLYIFSIGHIVGG